MDRIPSGEPRVRQRPGAWTGAALAVALVVVAATALVGLRGGRGEPSPSPSAGHSNGEIATPSPAAEAIVVGGWRWHELGLGPDGAVVRIPNGYLGRCGDSMCTSSTGWVWQTPPDRAIFSAPDKVVFTPLEIAHRPGAGYVILAEEPWYSADGIAWQTSATPYEPHGFMGLAASAAGFALIAEPNDTGSGDPRMYVSPDGAAWTQNGHLTYGEFLNIGSDPDTSAGLLANMPKAGNKYFYSADGRTWAPASVPAGTFTADEPHRADGSLVLYAGGAILRSTDGLKWTRLAAAGEPAGMAISGGRLVVLEAASGTGVARESADGGKTFRKLMDGVSGVKQFGDLVLIGNDSGGSFVGAPLGPSELAGTTPTATRLPRTPPTPSPTPVVTPAGGISREDAIRIAANAVHPPVDQVGAASAAVEMNPRYGRWIWEVSFLLSFGGPTGSEGSFADIDFFTGQVLGSGQWIS